MTTEHLHKVADLIRREHETILARWREEVRNLPAARDLDEPALMDHIPSLLEELADLLAAGSEQTVSEAFQASASAAHGAERFEHQFDIEEVVGEYNILRTVLHDLTLEHRVSLEGDAFRILNRMLDGAIGSAVKTHATRAALEVRRQRENYLGFVAHDLKSPLHALSASLSVLELTHGDDGPDPETVRLFEALRNNIARLDEITAQVLETNRDTGIITHPTSFELAPLVTAILRGFEPVGRAVDTSLTNEVPESVVVRADAKLVSRILENLITNAITFTPHGEVSIGARELDEAGSVECWVADTGMGIPEGDLDTIFDREKEAASEKGASGLGLTIVKSFVEAHGGQVSAESKRGAGSTFRFTLPGR